MKNRKTKFGKILWEHDFDIIDLWGGLNLIGWGIWLLLPFDTFDSSTVYRVFSSVSPENIWGIILVVFGVIRLWTMSRDRLPERLVVTIVTTFFWVFSFFAYCSSRPQAMLCYMTLFLAIVALWETVRVTQGYLRQKAAEKRVNEI